MRELKVIIAYDIADDRRRRELFKMLGAFGINVQYSFFEIAITPQKFVRLKNKIKKLLDKKEDKIVFIQLCEGCWRRVERWGYEEPKFFDNTIIL